MTPVKDMVQRVIDNKQPGMALTDHGNMSGAFQLYKGLRKAGLLPFPGMEAYLVSDVNDKTAKRYHVTMFALTTEGYYGLVRLTTSSHQRANYHYKPLLDLATLKKASDEGLLDGVVATSGCWFGWVQQSMEEHPDDPWPTMVRRAKVLASIFPHFYIEAQHHNQSGDDSIVQVLHQLAVRCGLPFVITQDAHYCDAKQSKLHSLMKGLAYGGEPGDVSFPGDSYHLASTNWIRAHYVGDERLESAWEDAESTYGFLIDNHAVKLPFLDTYQYHVPQIARKPHAMLVQLAKDGLAVMQADGLLPESLPKRYSTRLSNELDVIGKLGMSDYFLMIADVCQWCRANDIFINARGSANGSLVCYLLGITEIDPLKWNTMFERFMSLDRERPPDIDVDIEHDRRQDVIDYLASKYETVRIGTYMRLGYQEDDDGGHGSIFVSFLASERRRLGPEEYALKYKAVKSLDDLKVMKGTKFVNDLMALGDITVYRSPGVHAAGILLGTEDHPIEGMMPLMLIPSSETLVTQMVMDDCEDGGWIKVDFLGLRTLSVVHRTMRLIGMSSWNDIPLDDADTLKLIRQGRTNTGIFQLEGWTAAKGCREVGVKSVRDCILINALYRPATINAGHVDTYLRNRKDKSRIHVPHALFEPILRDTYGIPVYQEQVLDMLRALGFPTIELNKMLKAIKASNDKITAAEATFTALKSRFMSLSAKAGLTTEEADESWDFISTFSDYSFNRAHATAYGLLGYRTAWLKLHHPLEYHTALLDVWGGSNKESQYVVETRRMGVRILPADVNVSGASWTLDKQRKAIRRGLLSIKGVGEKAAMEIAANAPYSCIEDLIARTDSRAVTGGKNYPIELKGTIAALQAAGALRSLTGEDQ